MHTIYNPKRYIELETPAAWQGVPRCTVSERAQKVGLHLAVAAAIGVQIASLLLNVAEGLLFQSLKSMDASMLIPQLFNATFAAGSLAVIYGIFLFSRSNSRSQLFAFCVINSAGAVMTSLITLSVLIACALGAIGRG